MQHGTQQMLVGEEAAITVVRSQPYLNFRSFPSTAVDVQALSNTAEFVCFVLGLSGKQLQGWVLALQLLQSTKVAKWCVVEKVPASLDFLVKTLTTEELSSLAFA